MPHSTLFNDTLGLSHVNLSTNRARRDSWINYQTAVELRLDMLQGFWSSQLKAHGKTIFGNDAWEQLYDKRYPWSTYVNIMQDVINEVGRVYSGPAKRRFVIPVDSEETKGEIEFVEDEVYGEMIQDLPLNVVMRQAQRFTLALGGCLIRPALRDDDFTEWVFHVLTPDLFTPITDPADPGRLIGIIYIVPVPDNIGNTSGALYTTYEFSIADKDNPWFEVRDHHENVVMRFGEDGEKAYPYINPENDKPFLPFARIRFNNDPMELFNRSEGLDLWDASLDCALLEVIKNWQIMHSRKQIALIGAGTKDVPNQVADMTIPIIIPADKVGVDMQVLDMIDDAERFIENHADVLEKVLKRRGLTVADFKATGGIESGKALSIKNKSRKAYLNELGESMRQGEKELAWIMRVEWNNLNTDKIDESARFEVDFEDYLEGDPYENFQENKELVTMNIQSKVDLLRKFNKDIPSEKEGINIIISNEKLNSELSGVASTETIELAEKAPAANEGEETLTESPEDIIEETLEDREEPA